MTTPHYPALFEPAHLGDIALPNRIIMAPLTRSRAEDATDVPSPMAKIYYAQRASAGLIISEATQIIPMGKGYIRTPGIYTEAHVEAWRAITEAVHEAGGRIVMQLWHVGRISHTSLLPEGELPVAPSPIRARGQAFTQHGLEPLSEPRALRTDEIPGLIDDYVQAARRAVEAGFDGVEVHGANGYLIDQFLRDGANKREDAYGGSPPNRARLAIEIMRAVADEVGAGRTGLRISPTGRANDLHDSDPAAVFGYLLSELDSLGLSYVHMIEQFHDHPSDEEFEAQRQIRAAWSGPMILNGRYDAARGAQNVREGRATAIAYGRPFIANPDLVERFRQNAPLNEPDQNTFYTAGAKGYIDYPTLEQASSQT